MVDGTSLGQVVALEEACFHAEDIQTLEGDGLVLGFAHIDAIDITRRELVDLLTLLCLNGCTHIISSVVLKWGNWSYIVLIIFKIETKKRQ